MDRGFFHIVIHCADSANHSDSTCDDSLLAKDQTEPQKDRRQNCCSNINSQVRHQFRQ